MQAVIKEKDKLVRKLEDKLLYNGREIDGASGTEYIRDMKMQAAKRTSTGGVSFEKIGNESSNN